MADETIIVQKKAWITLVRCMSEMAELIKPGILTEAEKVKMMLITHEIKKINESLP